MLFQIRFAVVSAYAKAASMFWVVLSGLGLLCNVGGLVGNNIWLSFWSNDALKEASEAAGLIDLRLGIYALLGMVQGEYIIYNENIN